MNYYTAYPLQMEKMLKKYSQLPLDFQHSAFDNLEEIGKSLSTTIENTLHDRVDHLPLTPKEVQNYLETDLPLTFKVFYQRADRRRLGNLVTYELGLYGYETKFLVVCSLEEYTSKRFLMRDKHTYDIDELVSLLDPKAAEFEIFFPSKTIVNTNPPIIPNVIYYDLSAYRWVITHRLIKVGAEDVKTLAEKAVLQYLDDVVRCGPEMTLFTYYFIVSSAHLLRIPIRDETEEYFNDYSFEFDVRDEKGPEMVRMRTAINNLYPQIVNRLKML